jgi:hypothetical protein
VKEQGEADVSKAPLDSPRRAPVVPRVRVAWRKGWRAASSAWHDYAAGAVAADPDATQPFFPAVAALHRRAAPLRARLTAPVFLRRLLAVCAVFLVVIVSCGALNLRRGLDALAAARDARAQVAVMQATLRGGGATDPARLRAVQAHLNALAADLQRLQADVPLESVAAGAPGTSGVIHLLRMGLDLVHAGQVAMPAAIILAPHLKPLMSSLQGATDAAGQAPPLTTASVQQAAADFDQALPLLHAALSERAQVSDRDLSLLGLGKFLPILHTLDAYAPDLPKLFPALRSVTAVLPILLGVGQPTNFVLFSLDSDELRPTGGFMGNYALLTLSEGLLTSGVHLHDIYSLDCPLGRGACPAHPIPDRFAWMQVNPTHFGLRDTNLDPDYPTSARLAEQWLAQDGGPAVQGVISITPRVIEQILHATGPVTVIPYCTVVTATNLREIVHYFHLSNTLGISTWCPGPQTPSSDRKAFDAELGSILLRRVAVLPQAQQNELIRALVQDFQTRDIQLYFNDPGLEAALAGFGVDGVVQSPRSDSLYVVDTNTGGNYANADVQERITDHIGLDAHGAAMHDLTITYTYPKGSHLYSDVYEAEGGYWTYRDFVRVIVPANARFVGQDGCTSEPTDEPNHAVWGCGILFGQPNSVTLHFRWTLPEAAVRADGSFRYNLLIQHQAGTRTTYSVTIAPPPETSGSAQVAYDGELTQDQPVSAQFGA